MSKRFDLYRTELKKLFCKEVLVYLCVVPLLAVLVFGFLYQERVGREYPIVVVDEEMSGMTRLAVFYLESAPELCIAKVVPSLDLGRRAMMNGEAEAIVYLRRGVYRQILHKHPQSALVIVDGRNLVKVNSLLTGIAKTLGTARIGAELKLMDKYFPVPDRLQKLRPLVVINKALGNPSVDYFLFILTGLLVMAIWQGTVVGSSLGIARERGHNTLVATISAFGSPLAYIFWRSLAVLTLAIPVTLTAAAIFYGAFGAPFQNPLGILALLSLYTLTIVIVSALSGLFFRHATGVLQFFFFSTLPAFFMSGYPFPQESIPPLIRALAALLPSTPVLKALPRLNTISGSLPYLTGAFVHLLALCLLYLGLGAGLAGRLHHRDLVADKG